jgi:hypothetical protein
MQNPEPQMDDVDPKTGEPKYAGYDEYYAALRKWDREELARQIKLGSGSSAGLYGIGFGSAIAMILSFELNHSILWMIAHGICSWLYVFYRAWAGNY